MKVDDFNKLYLSELQELRSTKAQLSENLTDFAQRANNPALRDAILEHRAETEAHRRDLDSMISEHDAREDAHKDSSMTTLLQEASDWADAVEDPALRDAGIIASLQRMEHYEMAVSGSLANWAEKAGFQKDGKALEGILESEKQADATLTRLARDTINPVAFA